MRKYEGVFVFLPSVDEETRNARIERIKSVIEVDGNISNVDEWGMRKLAYEINHIREGYYVLMNFETTTENKEELDRIISILDDEIMRFMIVREDE